MKEHCCTKVDRPTTTTKSESSTKVSGKFPGSLECLEPPVVPPGKDQKSFERHNRVLLTQYGKSHPNHQIISDLMELTFAMRRSDILHTPMDIHGILQKYPFLQTDYVSY